MDFFKKSLAMISCLIIGSTVFSNTILADEISANGWQVIEIEGSSADADCFKINENDYAVVINNAGGLSNGGTDRWDLQFSYRDFFISTDNEYKISFDLISSSSGQFYTTIKDINQDLEVWHNGNNNAQDFEAYWGCIGISAGLPYHMDCTFSPRETIENAEWTFHIGGNGLYTSNGCFDTGTVLEFKNLVIENLSTGEILTSDNLIIGDSDTIGNSETSGILGDCNNDNIISNVDILTMKKYLLDLDSSISNADLNNDKTINILDLILLKNEVIK